MVYRSSQAMKCFLASCNGDRTIFEGKGRRHNYLALIIPVKRKRARPELCCAATGGFLPPQLAPTLYLLGLTTKHPTREVPLRSLRDWD